MFLLLGKAKTTVVDGRTYLCCVGTLFLCCSLCCRASATAPRPPSSYLVTGTTAAALRTQDGVEVVESYYKSFIYTCVRL